MSKDEMTLAEVNPDRAAASETEDEAALESLTGEAGRQRKVRRPFVRRIVMLAVFLAFAASIVFGLGFGTVSSFGWGDIVALCPLGALESMIAGKSVVLRGVICLAVAFALCVLVGKAFCSWVCPVPGVRNVIDAIRRRTPVVKTVDEGEGTKPRIEAVRPLSKREQASLKAGCGSCASCGPVGERAKVDSRHLVLGGALLSAAVFGFPVFCLVCPLGLTFATIVVIAQLFHVQVLSWGLLVFPLLLVLEVTVLRKWCSRFCPLGALMSLMSLPNRFFRPRVDKKKCLRSKGIDCRVCSTVCQEGLDPHGRAGMHECSKCGDCAENCPAGAISFPFRRS